MHRTVRTVGERMDLAEEMPRLCGLNAVSSIDAAVHDAFAIANGIGVYDGYSADFMPYDLSTHLGRRLPVAILLTSCSRGTGRKCPCFTSSAGWTSSAAAR